MGILNHAFRPNLSLHIEASYLNAQAERQLAPTGIVGDYPESRHPDQGPNRPDPWTPRVTLDPRDFPPPPAGFPPLPEEPFEVGVGVDTFAYRFTETGPRIDFVETDNVRGVIALAGGFKRWDWELGALYNHAVTSNRGEGYLGVDNVQAAMRGVDLDSDGEYQPNEFWNLFSPATNPNSKELADTLPIPAYRQSTTEVYSFDGQISGPIFELPAGDLALAVGFERRHESLSDESDPLSQASLNINATGFSGLRMFLWMRRPNDEINSFDEILSYEGIESSDTQALIRALEFYDTYSSETAEGSRDQTSIYGELLIPMLENLQMQVALRYENYSDFGTDLNPRIALGYQALPRLQLRGSWGTGFRAPSLAELYIGGAEKPRSAWDPKRCPEPGINMWPNFTWSGGCSVRVFSIVTGGNSDLRPETSESMTLGFTAEPLDNLAVSVDYWRIEIDDRIFTPGLERILRNEDALGPEVVIRDPPSDHDREVGISGFINHVNNLLLNLARQEVDGYDLEINYGLDSARFGQFRTQLLGTHMASNQITLIDGQKPEELAGTYGFPKNRANLNTFWSSDNWQLGLYGRWTDGFEDRNRDADVDSHIEWDTNISYSGINHLKLTLGVENMFDAEPPFAVGDFNLQGFPAQFYSMRGRFYYAQATLSL